MKKIFLTEGVWISFINIIIHGSALTKLASFSYDIASEHTK